MSLPKVHMFICNNTKEGKACCGFEVGSQLQADLKALLQERKLWGAIKVTRCGCLGFCEKGTAAVIYPQKKLYTQLTPHDKMRLLSELEETLKASEN